ncbi:MAG: NAD(P)H-quinone oxidoreductase, partial [Planifilum fulgidum]
MLAIVLEGTEPPYALQVREVPRPDPGEGQLLIKVMAASVNRFDLLLRNRPLPAEVDRESEAFRPGLDVAGIVEQ